MHFELAVLKYFSLCSALCVNTSAEVTENIRMSDVTDLLRALLLQTCLALFRREGPMISAGR